MNYSIINTSSLHHFSLINKMPSFSHDVWLTKQPNWDTKCLILLIDGSTTSPREFKLNDLLQLSDNFPINFPTDKIRCKSLISNIDESILQRNIDSTYPLIHESALHLCAKFIIFKRDHGSEIEMNLYRNMSLLKFIHRLLIKKAAAFVDPAYQFILPDGRQGAGLWESIGTCDEKEPLVLDNCLTYDELKLSSFLSISGYSYFINDGARNAKGKVEENRDLIQSEGVVVSLIGPKFSVQDLYEYEDIIISKNASKSINLENIFVEFYEEPRITYEEAKSKSNEEKFEQIRPNLIFNNNIYAKRLAVSFDTFLLEANHRAREAQKTAYVYLVGIGLGAWCISSHQEKVFVDTFAERLRVLGGKLSFISDVHLAYFKQTVSCGKTKNGNIFKIPGHPTGIKIHISEREPFQKLEDPDKLLVVSYAGDGNSLPGNEFWKGFFGNSSDSATAASCQVSELHNPHINLNLAMEKLIIATCGGDLISFQEYIATFILF